MIRWKIVSTGVALLVAASIMHAQKRPFTVRDSIELTTFNEPSEDPRDTKPIFSPDGKHFLIVTSRGIVDTDQIESKLWIYETASVRAFVAKDDPPSELRPRSLVTVLGTPVGYTLANYGALITVPRWSADSRHIYFLRQSAGGDRQLCEVDARSGVVHPLTPSGYDVPKYAVAGTTSVGLIARPIHDKGNTAKFFGEPINGTARTVTGLSISTILFPNVREMWQQPMETKLWMTSVGRPGRLIHIDGSAQIDLGVIDQLSISPNGRWLVRLLPVRSVPQSWADYEPNPVISFARIKPENPDTTSPTNLMRLKSYALIDLKSGKEVFRVGGPNSRPLGLGVVDEAVWSRDETRLLLTNTYLPLNGVTKEVRQQRLHPCVVLDVEVPSNELRCIVFSRVPKSRAEPRWLRDVTFGGSKDEVILRYFDSHLERYRLAVHDWVPEESSTGSMDSGRGSSAPSESLMHLNVAVRQSLNSSPVLWAKDMVSGKAGRLWDPNPQLSRMKLGEATVYRWKDRNGTEWTGGLVKPVGYIPGKRYPLVMQTHGFSDDNFKDVTDGAFPTAMAARPLASEGIMVVQVPDYHGKEIATVAEAEKMVEGYRSAIEQLTSDGLIDPKRVGIIGFSRTCWYVESALIKYPNMFAAATLADGTDMSYIRYHLFFDSGLRGEFEKINQGEPFGDGLEKWVKLAPGFHLDRVKTPVRIEAIGQRSLLGEWEIYSSLKILGIPVDLIYIPKGQHILQRPLDRMASQGGNVKWFRFWLECERQEADWQSGFGGSAVPRPAESRHAEP